MNRFVTKSKVMLIAVLAIVFVCLLLVVSVVEIRQYNIYKQQISAQEQQIEDLQNAKDYYNSKNYENNAQRDAGKANNGDIVFEEE